MHNHYLVIGSIFGVAMFGAGFLCADANAVSSSTTASVTVSAACTLSGA